LKKEQPKLSFADVGKQVGLKWKNANPATKDKFQKVADELKKKYDSDMKSYKSKSKGTTTTTTKKAASNASSGDDDDDDDDDDEEEKEEDDDDEEEDEESD